MLLAEINNACLYIGLAKFLRILESHVVQVHFLSRPFGLINVLLVASSLRLHAVYLPIFKSIHMSVLLLAGVETGIPGISVCMK